MTSVAGIVHALVDTPCVIATADWGMIPSYCLGLLKSALGASSHPAYQDGLRVNQESRKVCDREYRYRTLRNNSWVNFTIFFSTVRCQIKNPRTSCKRKFNFLFCDALFFVLFISADDIIIVILKA